MYSVRNEKRVNDNDDDVKSCLDLQWKNSILEWWDGGCGERRNKIKIIIKVLRLSRGVKSCCVEFRIFSSSYSCCLTK